MALLNGTAESLERQRAAIEDLNQKLANRRKWRRWVSSPAAWRTISTIC